jgi:hypothetical protein
MTKRFLKIAILLICGVISAQGGDPVIRTIRLASGGSVRIETQGNSDKVTIISANGNVISQCWCGGIPGTRYDDVVEFFTQFQSRLKGADKATVSRMIHFPLRINGPKLRIVKTRTELIRQFGSIFTPALQEKIHSAEPKAAFCNWQGAMLGSGTVWADTRDGGHLTIVAINP